MKLKGLVAAVLLVLLALEIVPCSFQEIPSSATGASGGFACRFEPLQVCDQGDPLLGALGNFLVLVAAPTVVVPCLAVLDTIPESAVFLPAGVKPSVDRPPKLFS